jgi:hypothetical protein
VGGGSGVGVDEGMAWVGAGVAVGRTGGVADAAHPAHSTDRHSRVIAFVVMRCMAARPSLLIAGRIIAHLSRFSQSKHPIKGGGAR